MDNPGGLIRTLGTGSSQGRVLNIPGTQPTKPGEKEKKQHGGPSKVKMDNVRRIISGREAYQIAYEQLQIRDPRLTVCNVCVLVKGDSSQGAGEPGHSYKISELEVFLAAPQQKFPKALQIFLSKRLPAGQKFFVGSQKIMMAWRVTRPLALRDHPSLVHEKTLPNGDVELGFRYRPPFLTLKTSVYVLPKWGDVGMGRKGGKGARIRILDVFSNMNTDDVTDIGVGVRLQGARNGAHIEGDKWREEQEKNAVLDICVAGWEDIDLYDKDGRLISASRAGRT